MADAFNEAYGIVQCKECPWYKSCVVPMRFTTEDIRRQMESTPGMGAAQNNLGMENLLSSMASAQHERIVDEKNRVPITVDDAL